MGRQDAESETLIPTFGGGFDVAHTLRAQAQPSHRADTDTYIAHTLKGEGFDASEDGTGAVRRLTPRECERLQGFPDDYTMIPWRGKLADQCPDGPRYKALGNSWAVPCARWIGRRIDRAVAALEARRAAA